MTRRHVAILYVAVVVTFYYLVYLGIRHVVGLLT